MEQAIFAAGCFWGVQFYFDQVPGVTKSMVGYTGGHTENPTYEEVCTHTTGHAEAVLLKYDPNQVTYETLVRHFFRMHDPTQVDRQGPDIGDSYRTGIFYFSEDQRATAQSIKEELAEQYNQPIATEITAAGPFFDAEDYHQKYAEKTGRGMCHIPYQPIH